MKKRAVFLVILIVVLFGGTFSWYFFRAYLGYVYGKQYRPPPAAVATQTAVQQNWTPMFSAIGSIEAINSINVTSQVSGQIEAINFQSGQMVKKGDSLIQLDDDIEQQNLRDAKANLELRKITKERNESLFKTRAVSLQLVDESRADYIRAHALVERTLLNIKYKNIVAPFDGKIGIVDVHVGEYINPGAALVSLQSLDPIYIDFNLPGSDLPNLYVNQPVKAILQAYPGQTFSGKISAIDSKVSRDTRNIKIRATFANPDQKLYPGLFADVVIELNQAQSVIVIPQSAIAYSLYGNTVYVVIKKDNQLIAVPKIVTLGERRGDSVAVTKGINAGDQVVVSGTIKLRENTPVVINNSLEKK